MSNLVVITNATSQQGRSVISAIQSDPVLRNQYILRGTSRDPTQPAAKTLSTQGVEMVHADVTDTASLRAAFTNAHVIFACTITTYNGNTYEHEVVQGRALVDAAVDMNVPYYIFSTLPSILAESNGALTNGVHFDGKEEVERYIRTLPIRSAFIAPGCFMSNFSRSLAPRMRDDGTYALSLFVRPDTQLPLLDTEGDMGKWVAAVLADFEKYEGKVICAATRMYTILEIAETIGRVVGKTVVYNQMPKEVWEEFLPEEMGPHLSDMFQFIQDYGYFGNGTQEKVAWGAQQARGKLVTFEEYLRAHPLSL
ncbi:hypothetical protein EYZ11_003816 [Aspergillus tanneri]|uniref:NmrA-like domain-containing protein n=1 Tax=Aspergillus tanneri TaxID=1220188 RepID=A0A4S3JMQ8_9EURO|nr:uncharacterized protein ATNIH1004_003521 [Aspergillus tanneri]KAA8650832.1 hypothetical protein ATNIH1004_003521 [Aspergillus tanneri]THC96710.1 hypothetical protein EYZ11_003816 [Aspergillus tanneri]